MLINELILFHKKKLNNWKLIYSHMKKELIIIMILFIASTVVLTIGLLKELLLLGFIAVLIILGLVEYIKRKKKKIMIRKYRVMIAESSKWEIETFYKVQQLRAFFEKNKVDNVDRIKEYKDFIHEQAEKSKLSNFMKFGITGIFLSFAVPVWTHFNGWVFNNAITSFEEALYIFVIIIILLLEISFIFAVMKNLFTEIFDTQYRRLRDLGNLLELVYLSFNENNIIGDLKDNSNAHKIAGFPMQKTDGELKESIIKD